MRNDNIWPKTNAMPESVEDWLSGRHEYLFLFTRSPRYRFDLDAVRVPQKTLGQVHNGASGYRPDHPSKQNGYRAMRRGLHPRGANPGDVWSIPTTPTAEAHFATFPREVPRRCILAGCPAGGIVLAVRRQRHHAARCPSARTRLDRHRAEPGRRRDHPPPHRPAHPVLRGRPMTAAALQPPFAYFGGKTTLAARIVGLLRPHEHYMEPFCGGSSVLLAKAPSARTICKPSPEFFMMSR